MLRLWSVQERRAAAIKPYEVIEETLTDPEYEIQFERMFSTHTNRIASPFPFQSMKNPLDIFLKMSCPFTCRGRFFLGSRFFHFCARHF